MPFGAIELFFVPHYWYPESLFNLMRQYGFGVEGFIYAFSIAGIAAVVYEFIGKKGLKKAPGKESKKLHLAPFFLFVLVFLAAEFFTPQKPMLNLLAAFVCGSVLTGFLRKDLIKQMAVAGIIFGVFYFFLFSLLNAFFNDFISRFYSNQIFNNFKLLGVPLEEILGAFCGGAFWSVLYEYTRSYKNISKRN